MLGEKRVGSSGWVGGGVGGVFEAYLGMYTHICTVVY